MTVDVPYVLRFDSFEEEFISSDELFEAIVSSLWMLPEEYLPAGMKILNIDEFAIEWVERDVEGFSFFSENNRSRLGRAFKKFMKGWFNE